ncbi:MAG: hypothetical protein BWZ02_01071 [Lentisphaerae bacterium ADurb.BinA184]|nr:MAG: hypothetical protein BWZ02_01071 [Lentisphaerae bacterium ADurb.BinA184]
MIKAVAIHHPDGTKLRWEFDFTQHGTMRMNRNLLAETPEWILLTYCQCPACTLDPVEHPICPVAEVLSGYAYDLRDRKSFEQVTVEVFRDNAPTVMLRNIPLQTVVSEVVRLAVFQYECPIGRQIKPALVKLPPFPTSEEILAAFAQAFAAGRTDDEGGLRAEDRAFLESLHDLFGNLSVRLDRIGRGDAHLNGVVILHSLAVLFTLSAPELIRVLSDKAKPAAPPSLS